MKKPASVSGLERLGRERLSHHFFMRDFLNSEISNFCRIPNIPEDPDLALWVGRRLAQDLLEPLVETFGPIVIRSAYRSVEVNGHGAAHGLNCASNETNRAAHIWDLPDPEGRRGASVSVVIPWFADQYEMGRPWTDLAWWCHDHLDFHAMTFFATRAAFNLAWREQPERRIAASFGEQRVLLRPGDTPPPAAERGRAYHDFPRFRGIAYPELPAAFTAASQGWRP